MINIKVSGKKIHGDFETMKDGELQTLLVGIGQILVGVAESFGKENVVDNAVGISDVIKRSLYADLRMKGYLKEDTFTLGEII